MMLNGILALLGPFAAHRLSTRFGRIVPISVAMLIQMVTIVTLVYSFESFSYASSMIVLSLSYVFVIPYFRGVMASLDPTGRVVGASTAFVSVGAAVGPGFGGVILNMGGSYQSVAWIAVAFFLLTLVLVIPVARWADVREFGQSTRISL